MNKTSKKGILGFLLLVLLPALTFSQTWSSNATIPGGGRNAWSCATDKAGQKVYLFGAYNGNYLDQAYVYNAGSFNQLTGYPGGLGSTFGYTFFLNNKVYYGGGVDGGYVFFNSTFEYNPSTGFGGPWLSKDPIPTPGNPFGRAYCFFFEINNIGYVGEGFGGTNSTNMITANDFLRFDPTQPSGSQWSTMAPYPGLGEYSHAAASLNGMGYAGLGASSIYSPVNENDFWAYNPTTNTWNVMATFPGAGREGASLIPLEGCNKLVLVGGFNRNNIFYDDVWVFDPNDGPQGSWTSAGTYPGGPRAWGAWGGFNDEIYFGMGWDNNFTQLHDDWWKATFTPPVASFSVSDTTLCAGDIINFTDASTGTPTSWNWSFSGGNPATSTLQNPSAQYNTNGSFTTSLIVKNVCSSDTLTKIGYIDVNPGTDSILPVSPVCANIPPFNLITTSVSGTWWGTGITNPTTGLFDPTIAGTGTHTVYHTSCSDTAMVQIQIGALQDASITTAPGTFCQGYATVDLNSLNPGGVWSGTGITDATNGIVTIANAGTGTFVYEYLMPGVCADSTTVTLTFTLNADMTIISPASICENNPAITLTPVSPGGIWAGNGITNTANGTFEPQVSGAGIQNITYTIAGVCGGVANANITVNPQPTINPIADVVTGCAPLSVNFTPGGVPAGSTVAWTFGNGLNDNSSGMVSTIYTVPGCYDVFANITDANGCSNQVTINNLVCVNPTPDADFTASTWQTTTFTPVVDFSNLSVNATSYTWSIDGVSESTTPNLSYDFGTTAGEHEVCLMAQHVAGCSDFVCHMITIKDLFMVYLPNAFTPNGDGLNDMFILKGNDINPDGFELRIFNRWGEQVFFTSSLTQGWDGTEENATSKDEVYVWKIKAVSMETFETIEKTGHITVLR
ncbi:MAG: PKD domain-containing protein [Flavobacteriales bacterium]